MSDLSGKVSISPQNDGIEHVVLLILENHSFDQMLGALQEVLPELDGVTPDLAAQRFNLTANDVRIYQRKTIERQMRFDPHHEHVNVVRQLEGNGGGFVREFQAAYAKCSQADLQEVMGYYPLGFLPALHTLGKQFTICDRWFASMPGPTWPNRFFALSGTCKGQVLMPAGPEMLKLHWYTEQDQATLARSAGTMSSGSGAGAPAAAAAAAPAKSASSSQAAATTGVAPKKLPKTASQLPLVGLLGLASLVAAFGLSARRRRATR